jgi:hypothetical protein
MSTSPNEIKVSPKNLISKKIEVSKKSVLDLNEGNLEISKNKNDLKYFQRIK